MAYQEPERQQFHFSSRKGWLNDPNGLCFYQGTYHLFYQHNPAAVHWGPMHWGHATGTDLIHWQEQPIALYPDESGVMFSGCAVVDEQNLTGLGVDPASPPLLFFYAAARVLLQPLLFCLLCKPDSLRHKLRRFSHIRQRL